MSKGADKQVLMELILSKLKLHMHVEPSSLPKKFIIEWLRGIKLILTFLGSKGITSKDILLSALPPQLPPDNFIEI